MELTLKNTVNLLQTRSDFFGVDVWTKARPIVLQCYQRQAGSLKNADLQSVITNMDFTKGDGSQRFVYFGNIKTAKTRSCQFYYRADKVALQGSDDTQPLNRILFDYVDIALLQEQWFYFEGFVIDRGA